MLIHWCILLDFLCELYSRVLGRSAL